MPVEGDEERNAQRPRPRWQFSVRALFGLTICVAVACSVLFAMPDRAAAASIVVISVLLPAMLTTAAICGGGYQRTFCIGALFPASFLLFGFAVQSLWMLPEVLGKGVLSMANPYDAGNLAFWFRVQAGGCWGSSIIAGLLCLGVRRLIEKGRETKPQP
jgi:hypothetical protein